MSKSTEKLAALALRRKGESIKDIAKKLQVSPGSVSLWCQSIALTKKQEAILRAKQTTAGLRGRQMGADMNKAKRIIAMLAAEDQARTEVHTINTRELFFLGLGIYWGEGVKSRSGQATVVNSDPRILTIAIKWFVECLGVAPLEFRPYVYISTQHRDREDVIMDYWAKTLSLPRSQFKNPMYVPHQSKQKYANHDTYYGVVALRVAKSTNLKYRILALLQAVSERLE
jgi:hypothetical protein